MMIVVTISGSDSSSGSCHSCTTTVVGTARSVDSRTPDRKVSSSIAGRAERRENFFLPESGTGVREIISTF